MEAGCGSTCPVPGGFYSYSPNIGGNAVLLATYALLVPSIFYLGVRSRTAFFSTVLATGAVLGLLGFIGRVLLHESRDSPGYFLLSLLGTVLGPSLLSASIFVVFPHILTVYGERLSPFKPMLAELALYTLITVAIGVQVVGVVFVVYGFNGVTRAKSSSIIAAGLGLQASALLGSAAVYFTFVFGLSSGRGVPDDKHSTVYGAPQFGRFLRGIEISTSLLLAYAVYRVVEMAGGVESGLFQNEAAFMVMDGALPLASGTLLTAFHPGAAFGTAWEQTSPRQPKRPSSLPLHDETRRVSYNTHHAYDPNIRKQFSPKSPNSQRTTGSSPRRPEMLSGSPGLPSNPRPGTKPPSPMIPSPISTVATSKRYSDNKRYSDRSERRMNLQKDMVNSDALW